MKHGGVREARAINKRNANAGGECLQGSFDSGLYTGALRKGNRVARGHLGIACKTIICYVNIVSDDDDDDVIIIFLAPCEV